jgi:hypothetical protein
MIGAAYTERDGTLEVVRLNLLSPPVLAFALGVVATLARSDLKFPDQLYSALSMYLMLAIGLKGGAELSQTPLAVIGAPLAATLALGVFTPLTGLWRAAAAGPLRRVQRRRAGRPLRLGIGRDVYGRARVFAGRQRFGRGIFAALVA